MTLMPPDHSPHTRALRVLMTMDATVLFILGGAFVCGPRTISAGFHLGDLPLGVAIVAVLTGGKMDFR